MKIKKKIISSILSLVLIFSCFPMNTFAKQSRHYNFNKDYTLTGNNIDDIVSIAKAQIGMTESQLGYTEAWCADFVNDCAKLAKIPDDIIPYNYSGSASCTNLYNYMVNNCGATKTTSKQKGDLVFYYCSSCGRYVHVGIMKNSTTAIEGNTSNKVAERTSYSHTVSGVTHSTSNGKVTRKYLRPQYLPSTPKISSVSASSEANEITIKWNSVSNADKYIVQGRKAGGTYETLDEVTGTSYVHKGLDTGCLYWYRVQAKNSSGKSGYSTASGAYTKPKTPTTSDSTTNSIKVNWTKDADGASNYELLARKCGDSEYTTIAENINGYSYTHTGLEAGTQYYYKIKAHNTEHASIVSQRSADGYGFTKLKAPIVTSKDATTVSLDWSRGSLNGDYTYTYRICRKEASASSYSSIAVISSSSYKDSGLKPNTTYYYYIDVLRNGSWIINSEGITVTTNAQLAENISISAQNITLAVGNTYGLSASISPSNTTNKTITWSSNNSNVASVSNGTVTANGVGTATITAKTSNGLTATCTVKVDTPENLCSHSFSEWSITTAATCEDDGNKTRSCSKCGKTENEIIYATGHNYSDEWTITKEASCTEYGEKQHLCITCGEADVSSTETTEMLSHTCNDKWIIEKEATCLETGLKHKVCGVCGEKCETEELPAISHTYNDVWTIEQEATCQQGKIEYHSCINCEEKEYRYSDESEHNYVVTDSKDPSNTEAGYITYTCSWCNSTYLDELPIVVNSPEIMLSSSSATAGETVDLTITLANNPGIASAKMKINYNADIMTLVNVTDAGVLGATSHSPSLTSPYTLYWNNGSAINNFTTNGTIATLTFKINSIVESGVYPISIEMTEDDVLNVEMETVAVVAHDGEITIEDVCVGDLNNDGKVNVKDNMMLSRFIAEWPDYTEDTVNAAAADVNYDNKVNVKDDMILARHIAEWPGYETLPYTE